MAEVPSPRRVNHGYAVETVQGTVTDLIPAYHLVYLETADGRGLSLTRNTKGIDLATLHVGQRVECTVTVQQPRVVQAHVIA